MEQETNGDIIRIYITPASDTHPWIQIFRYPYGIPRDVLYASVSEVGGVDAKRTKTRDEIALEIGREIIRNSKILFDWYNQKELKILNEASLSFYA